jgi:hypothetical protein
MNDKIEECVQNKGQHKMETRGLEALSVKGEIKKTTKICIRGSSQEYKKTSNNEKRKFY